MDICRGEGVLVRVEEQACCFLVSYKKLGSALVLCVNVKTWCMSNLVVQERRNGYRNFFFFFGRINISVLHNC